MMTDKLQNQGGNAALIETLREPWRADFAMQPKNSSERFDVIYLQQIRKEAADEIQRLQDKCNNFADKCHAANRTNAALRSILAEWRLFASDVVPRCAAGYEELESLRARTERLMTPNAGIHRPRSGPVE
jgi:hypothetical protein